MTNLTKTKIIIFLNYAIGILALSIAVFFNKISDQTVH